MATSALAKIKQSINQSATVTQTGGSSTGGSSSQSFSSTTTQTATNTNSGNVNSPPPPPVATDFFRFGTLSDPAISPAGDLWDGTGNSTQNFNITDGAFNSTGLGDVETGLAVKTRGGATDIPTGTSLPAGGTDPTVADYSILGGAQPGAPTRAAFNIDYVVNTAQGIAPGDTIDLASKPSLAAFNSVLSITQEGPNFAHATTETYDLNAATHVWTNVANPADAFGGDDFSPAKGASDQVMAHIATNSINFGFANFVADFGPLATSVAPGAQYDVKLSVSTTGASPVPVTTTESLITLHG